MCSDCFLEWEWDRNSLLCKDFDLPFSTWSYNSLSFMFYFHFYSDIQNAYALLALREWRGGMGIKNINQEWAEKIGFYIWVLSRNGVGFLGSYPALNGRIWNLNKGLMRKFEIFVKTRDKFEEVRVLFCLVRLYIKLICFLFYIYIYI